jgi:hypothetical protein
VGIDGSIDEHLECDEGETRYGAIGIRLYTEGEVRTVASSGGTYCGSFSINTNLAALNAHREVTNLTPPQITACTTDLQAAARELGANLDCP